MKLIVIVLAVLIAAVQMVMTAVEAVRIMRNELKGDLLNLNCVINSCQDNIIDFIRKIN